MTAGVRNATNRLVAIVVFAALLAVGLAVAVEAGAALADAGSQLDPPIPYAGWWDEAAAIELTKTELALVSSGVVLLGLGLVAFELWPRRRDRRSTVSESNLGTAELRIRSVQPYLADRLRALDWVRDPALRVKVRDGAARVEARPLARRQTGDDDLEQARELLAACVTEVGLEPSDVAVKPRSDRKTLRVR